MVVCFGVTFAQTNLDLETWSTNGFGGEDPDGWGTLNGFMALGAPQSTWKDTTDPGEALASAKLESLYFPGATTFGAPSDTVGAMLSIGGPPGFGPLGIAYTKRPTSVDFMYKANPLGSDTGVVLVQLTHYDGSATVLDGVGVMVFPVQVNTWTATSITITYLTSATPDSLQIVAASSGVMLGIAGVGAQMPGSQLFLDSFAIVLPANTAPVAVDDAATTDSAVAVTVDVQANDTDAEGGAMTTNIFSGPSNGTAVVMSGIDIEYTPNVGFTGNDTVWYELCDDGGTPLCDTAMLVITVVTPAPPANSAPTAANDVASTDSAVAVTVGVQVNDNDPDSDPLTTMIVTQPTNGTATVVGDSIMYTPNAGFVGTDTVVYQVCDNGSPSLCDTANLIITVNSPPVGIEALFSMSNLVLYPNPVSSGILNIEMSFNGVVNFRIYDLLGKQIKTVTLKDDLSQINVSDLTKGVYLYQVIDKKGILVTNGNFTVAK